jgi:hypothetical protein
MNGTWAGILSGLGAGFTSVGTSMDEQKKFEAQQEAQEAEQAAKEAEGKRQQETIDMLKAKNDADTQYQLMKNTILQKDIQENAPSTAGNEPTSSPVDAGAVSAAATGSPAHTANVAAINQDIHNKLAVAAAPQAPGAAQGAPPVTPAATPNIQGPSIDANGPVLATPPDINPNSSVTNPLPPQTTIDASVTNPLPPQTTIDALDALRYGNDLSGNSMPADASAAGSTPPPSLGTPSGLPMPAASPGTVKTAIPGSVAAPSAPLVSPTASASGGIDYQTQISNLQNQADALTTKGEQESRLRSDAGLTPTPSAFTAQKIKQVNRQIEVIQGKQTIDNAKAAAANFPDKGPGGLDLTPYKKMVNTTNPAAAEKGLEALQQASRIDFESYQNRLIMEQRNNSMFVRPTGADIESAAQMVANRQITPQEVPNMYRAPGDGIKILGRAQEIMDAENGGPGTNPDATVANLAIGAKNANAIGLVRQATLATTALSGVSILRRLSGAWQRNDLPMVNNIAKAAGYQTGNTLQAVIKTVTKAVGDEAGSVLGIGTASDFKTQLGIDLLNMETGPQAYDQQLDAVQGLLERKRSAMTNTMGGFGGMYQKSATGLTPAAAGGGSGAPTPAVGTVMKGYRFNGGDASNQSNWTAVQ